MLDDLTMGLDNPWQLSVVHTNDMAHLQHCATWWSRAPLSQQLVQQ